MLDLQPDHLARTQTGAVAEAEQQPVAHVVAHRQQAAGLILAEDERHLLRLLDEIHLGQQIEASQRDAEQKAQARHGTVARDRADARLAQMQLEAAQVVGRGGLRRAIEPGREPPAGANMADLGARHHAAGNHILDHALAQRAAGGRFSGDGLGSDRLGHGEFQSLSEVVETSILKLGLPARYAGSINWLLAPHALTYRLLRPAPRAVAQRLCALAHCGNAATSASTVTIEATAEVGKWHRSVSALTKT